MVGRKEVLFVAQVPFAEGDGVIAGLLEKRGEDGFCGGKPKLVFLGQGDGVVVAADVAGAEGAFHSGDSLLVAAGEEGGARGRAFGALE